MHTVADKIEGDAGELVGKVWQEDNGEREEMSFYHRKWEIGWFFSQNKVEEENLISDGVTWEADWLAERSVDVRSEKCDAPVKPSGENSCLVPVVKMM